MYADRAVGLAAITADGQEGASLCRIPPSNRKPESTAAYSLPQYAVEQEDRALQAIQLRSGIISAEVILARLKKDVIDWRATASDVKEAFAYATERHQDTRHYNAADVLSIRAQMSGGDGGIVVESNSSSRAAADGGPQRSNGFFKLSSDEDFFGNKNGKNKKSKKSSKQRPPKNGGKAVGESGMDILSSIAGIAAGGSVNMEESSQTEQGAVALPEASDEGASKRSKPAVQDSAEAGGEGKLISAKSLRSRR